MDHTLLHRRLSADLAPGTLYALLRLRVEALVVERGCVYQDLDGRDLDATTRHFWLAPESALDQPQATLRMLELSEGVYRIDRICAARHAPAEGCARRLLEAALAEVGDAVCSMDVESGLSDFYGSFGFVVTGAEFVEHGITQVPMRRAATARMASR